MFSFYLLTPVTIDKIKLIFNWKKDAVDDKQEIKKKKIVLLNLWHVCETSSKKYGLRKINGAEETSAVYLCY